MSKTSKSQLKASKLYRQRQKALGMVEIKVRMHRSLEAKFRALVAMFKKENQ